jgi:hypothetical protein
MDLLLSPRNHVGDGAILATTAQFYSPFSFVMMIVPLAANMPPTPWLRDFRARHLGWGDAAHLAHAFFQRSHAVHAEMYRRKRAYLAATSFCRTVIELR